jgi:hypothetical protein
MEQAQNWCKGWEEYGQAHTLMEKFIELEAWPWRLENTKATKPRAKHS